MKSGNIRVQTDNIFPIIKKFLYNEHDIFLRELISNAVDATQKLKTLASVGEFKGEIGNTDIHIYIDKENKTLTIKDKGLGMTEEEVDKYINQVAFSGAEEFVNKYKGQAETNIIGHFGLGFYSAFMVSEKVMIQTKSFKDAPAVQWECDGSPNFTISSIDKAERGTDIILHLAEDSLEFLEASRIETILNKFCKFLAVPIFFDNKQINNPKPVWTKKPSENTDEDYKNFYKELYPYSEAPLFWIHLNVDYPFNLTGVLYFPVVKQNFEVHKNKISLYCNQVFVTDEVKDIVPDFLMLLHGVIDSPDIPLNVSRSYLQGDPNVKKINNHITKKVADKLEEIFKNDRKTYENRWASLSVFVKYGMITDDKFLEKSQHFVLFESATEENKFYTLDELKTQLQANHTNQENKIVVLYSTDIIGQDAYITKAKERGYTIIKLDTLIDSAFVNNIEMKWSDLQFKRVDADIVDNLIENKELKDTVLTSVETENIKKLFEDIKIKGINTTIEIRGLATDTEPIIATQTEWMRRMKDMSKINGGGADIYGQMPDSLTLTINGNHPIYKKILVQPDAEEQVKLAKHLTDLALLSQGLLKGNDLTQFIQNNLARL